jgi:hypothetical protein
MFDLVKRKSSELTNEDPAALFEGYGKAARPFDGDLLVFNKGDFLGGQEKEAVPIGTRFRPKMNGLLIGWVRWQANAQIDQRMGLVVEGFKPARRDDLGDLNKENWERDSEKEHELRDPWQFTNHLPMDRLDDGKAFTFVTSSKGGLGCIGELCKEYGKHVRQHPDEDPVIEIEVGSYLHRDRSRGRVKYPIFRVVGWVKDDDSNGAPPDARPPEPPLKPVAAAKPARRSTAQQPHF